MTFRANFPEADFYEGTIERFDAKLVLKRLGLKRGQLDCIIGGPPCQSFSYNNHHRSATDTRARLFRTYLRIVDAMRPATLVMENVPGMLTISKGGVVSEIQSRLSRLGYSSEVRILYAEDFGVPQRRRRLFFVATRVGSPERLFPIGSHGPSAKPRQKKKDFVHRWETTGAAPAPLVTVASAISDLPILRNGSGDAEREYRQAPQTEYQRVLRGSQTILFNHVCHDLTASMMRRIRYIGEGENWKSIPRRLLPAGMRRARASDHTKRYGRLSRNDLASTILTKCDPHWGAYVHPTQQRTLSVREAARIQGFPDNFKFVGEHISKHYEQVGNAVPVPLARAIGRAVSAAFESNQ